MINDKKREGGNTLPKITKRNGEISARPALAQQNGFLYLNDLIDNLSDAFIATDIHFKITQWNKAAERMYGWGLPEVQGHLLADFLKTEYETGNGDSTFQNIMAEGFGVTRSFKPARTAERFRYFRPFHW